MFAALLKLSLALQTDGCIVSRKGLCECEPKYNRVSCTRLADSVDSILEKIPKTTQELIMRRVWVDNAVELNPRNFVKLRNLQLIDFAYNRISEIHMEAFRYCSTIIHVVFLASVNNIVPFYLPM